MKSYAALILVTMIACSESELNLKDQSATDVEVLKIIFEDIRLDDELKGKSTAIWKIVRVLNDHLFKGLDEIGGFIINKAGPYQSGYTDKIIIINKISNLNGTYEVFFRVLNSPVIDWKRKLRKRRDVNVVLDSNLNILKWTSEEVEYWGVALRPAIRKSDTLPNKIY